MAGTFSGSPINGKINGRIGILGGTFDPIHIGHLILAEEAWFQLRLDRIYLAPAGNPPHKRGRRMAPVEDRLCMAELATADVDYAIISRIDADRPGPHYTSDLVRLLQQQVGPGTDIYFLMGMDSLRDLPTWHEAQWLVDARAAGSAKPARRRAGLGGAGSGAPRRAQPGHHSRHARAGDRQPRHPAARAQRPAHPPHGAAGGRGVYYEARAVPGRRVSSTISLCGLSL